MRAPGTKPQTLEVQIPDGPTVEIDISGQEVTPEKINKLLENVKRQYAPTPFQQAYKAMGPPAAKVRDVATQGVGMGLDAMSRMSPEGMSLQAPPMQPQVSAPIAQNIAQQTVPQTPGQAASMAAMALLAGPAAPAGASVGGMAGTGFVGALSRSFLPMLAEQGVNYAVGEGVDPKEALADVMVSLATEGAHGLIPWFRRRKFRDSTIAKIGSDMAQEFGTTLDQVTSVKGLRTPENFRHVMSGMGTDTPKPHETVFAREMSKAIDEAQKEIRGMLNPAMREMDQVARDRAMSMLEEVAGVKPALVIPKGSPLRSEPSHRVYNDPPDVLFEKGISQLRLKRQAADALEGAERNEAFKEYGALREQMEGALSAVNPMLAKQYDAMNKQYARDMDVRNFLWALKKRGVFESGPDGPRFDAVEFGKHVLEADRLMDETGLFGGSDAAIRYIAGPTAQPGSRATIHEGYTRLFTTLPMLPVAISLARNPQMAVLPQGPVSSARARALSDWMMTQMMQYGMTPQVNLERQMMPGGVPMGGGPQP